jgi:predicted ATPase/transcriptional regulator with XRE-family HTH domain
MCGKVALRSVADVSPDRLPPFAIVLREIRREAGLTQEELARSARVGVRTLRDLETGRATRPQRSTVELLAKALDLAGVARDDFVAAARTGRTRRARPTLRLRPATPLVGRDTMVRDVATLIDVAAVVTLVGLAGVGKSALALSVGHSVAEHFPGGVGGLVVTETSTETEILASALSALEVARLEDLPGQVGQAPALVVVDAAERSPSAAAAACERLRRRAPALHLLITSRHPVGISGEHEWPVPPLDVPPPGMRGAGVLTYPSTRLFVQRLRQVRPRPIRPEETDTLGALMRRLGGLPLALELAAARGRVLELEELLARSGDDGGEGDPAGHHVRDAVMASWALLLPNEQACLGRLATLQWRWSVELAEDLLADAPPAGKDVVALIDRLVGLGLVSMRADGAEMRFWLLDAVRDVALEQAAAAGSLRAARERHAEVLAGLAVRTTAMLEGTTGTAAAAAERRLDGLIPDLYAALDYLRQRPAEEPGDDEYVRRLRADLERCRELIRASSERWHDSRGLPRDEIPD